MVFGGDDDDKERFWKNQAKALALSPFNGIPVIRTMMERSANAVSGNSFYDVGAGGGYCNSGGCNYAGISLRREDDGVFALYAFDVDYFGPDYSFRGITADGGSVNLSTPLGTGDWLNLTRVSWDVETPAYFPYADDIGVSVDNIVVSAVPVPAAVWLFGSGLAVLGWLRRRS